MITLPYQKDKKWIVSYLGDYFGHITNAFNIDLFASPSRIKAGRKFIKHTTSDDITDLTTVYGFTNSNLATGESDDEYKLKVWGIADDMVLKLNDVTDLFEEDLSTDLGTVDTGSDILNVKDASGNVMDSTQVSIAGSTDFKITGEGSTTKWGQTIIASGPLSKIYLNLKKVGGPTDNFVIKIQEDNSGSPSGSTLATITLAGTELTTSYVVTTFDIDDFTPTEYDFDLDKTYWVLLERSGAASSVNYYVMRRAFSDTEASDPYINGSLKSWNGSAWKSWDDDTVTDEELVTANNVVPGNTGWGTPANVYAVVTNDAYYGSASPGDGITLSHIWKTLGFAIPASAIVLGITIKIRYSQSVDTYGSIPITVSLTKDADAVAGVSKSVYCSTVITTATKGSSTDLWGVNWTPAEINSANFGIRLDSFKGASGVTLEQRCMYLYATVYYQEEDTAGVKYMDSEMTLITSCPVAEERLYVSTDDDILFLDEEDTSWQSVWKGLLKQAALNSSYPRILKSWGLGEVIYIANDNKISSMAKNASNYTEVDYERLLVPPNFYANWMVTTKNAVFTGFINKDSLYQPSLVVYYEPMSEFTRSIEIPQGATMGFLKDDNCYIIDIKGRITVWNGNGFTEVNFLPTYFINQSITLPHRNAFTLIDGDVHMLWKGIYPCPMGLWRFDDNNFYHTASVDNLLEAEETGALYFDGTNIYCGAEDGDSVAGVYINDNTASKNAWFVTSRIPTPNIKQVWHDIVLKYLVTKPGVSTGDFVVKYRTKQAQIGEGFNADKFNGTWTSGTIFTCTDVTFQAYITAEQIEVGDEVIIRTGNGAGRVVHITKIATTTITIDTNLAYTSGDFTFSVENWKKINFSTFQNTKFNNIASLGDTRSEWIQFKISIINDFLLEEIQLSSVPDLIIDKK